MERARRALPLALLACLAPAQLLLPEFQEEPGAPPGDAPQDYTAAPRVAGPHKLCSAPEVQYSGYLPAGRGASYFFWLARAAAPESRAPLPMVLWLSGGPGISSSFGLLFENGPCRLEGPTASGWRAHRNPWSWTNSAHVVWVDQPSGVGFSEGPNDVRDEAGVAEHMYSFLLSFYGHFQDLLQAPLFIAGESFAGHFLPAIATKVLREARGPGPAIQLSGIAMGNALVRPVEQLLTLPDMAWTGGGRNGSLGGGVVDERTYRWMSDAMVPCRTYALGCQQRRDVNWCTQAVYACFPPLIMPIWAKGLSPYNLRQACGPELRPLCVNISLLTAFLNDQRVKESLGVNPAKPWTAFSINVALRFTLSGDYFRRYDDGVAALLDAGVPVLVYNGDCDYLVNWMGSKLWLKQLPWRHQEEWLQAPDVDYVVGGRKRGRQRSVAGLTFLQLYDAGHMVPHDQPEVAFAMISEFISLGSNWTIKAGTALTTAHGPVEARRSALLGPTWSGRQLVVGAGALLLGYILVAVATYAALGRWARRNSNHYARMG